MPRLLLFVPCERPLLGADNSLSLINVLQTVNLVLSSGELQELREKPEPAQVSAWYVISVWQQEPGDEGARFEQRVTLTDPDGEVRIEALTEFELVKPYHRNMGKIQGFPVFHSPGECTLSVSLRKIGDLTWVQRGTYPLRIIFRRTTDANPSAPAPKSQTH